MRTVLTWIVGAVVAMCAAVGLIAVLGSRLPVDHVVTRSIVVPRAPSEVLAAIRDFGGAAAWRTGLARVEVIDARHFREVGERGTVTYEIVADGPDGIVTRIADTGLGYTGSWTYRVAPDAAGARVGITEAGAVTNVFFRFMSHYFFSPTATLDVYLADLARHLG